MPSVTTDRLGKRLPLHRVSLPGTRAVTVLVAFDAGARTERPEENGMAHFLEHLVFKGGEKFPTYRDVNETAERMGAQLNAYTSHDLVAFHITARAEAAMEAADLLTDFVARPHLDAAELDRERGVVIQEIARANDQPATVAEHLIDAAAFGDHALGRPVLGPAEHLRNFHARGDRGLPRAALGRASAGARSWSATWTLSRPTARVNELFERFPDLPSPGPYEPRPGVRAAHQREAARLQPVAPAPVLPPDGRRERPARAGRTGRLLHAPGRLDGIAPVRRDP